MGQVSGFLEKSRSRAKRIFLREGEAPAEPENFGRARLRPSREAGTRIDFAAWPELPVTVGSRTSPAM